LKVLLDTNVLVAAFLSRGACHELVEHCSSNHEVVASEQILEELGRTLVRKARIPPPTPAISPQYPTARRSGCTGRVENNTLPASPRPARVRRLRGEPLGEREFV
jgi:hypothetical protein